MTLLYDRIDLEERVSNGYGLWKGCHITSYALAAIFGLLNFYFLFLTMKIFGGHCILDPHQLVFNNSTSKTFEDLSQPLIPSFNETVQVLNVTAVNEATPTKRDDGTTLMLDLAESHFHLESYCDMPLYTPILSTIFGMVWGALFIMCPAGGRSDSGLSEPWRILSPALLFAIVFVIFGGYNFFTTNSGLQQLCAQFYNVTHSVSCTRDMDGHIPTSQVWLSASVAIGLTRAASAGTWACWAAACALLLSRCIAGADFTVNHTQVHLHDNTQKKLTPLLKERNMDRKDLNTASPQSSRVNLKLDTANEDSLTSEPTTMSELNTSSYAPVLNSGRNGLDHKEHN